MTQEEIIKQQDEIIGQLTRKINELENNLRLGEEMYFAAKQDMNELITKAELYDELKIKFETTCEKCLEMKSLIMG